MGEVAVEADYSSDIPLHPSASKRHEQQEHSAISITPSPEITKPTNRQTYEHNPQEAWLPITESRNGNTFFATFHILCSGIGMQALVLPVAFATLGWAWGIICLSVAFVWQLYTIWILVRLHESVAGIRYSRYLHLAMAAFGGGTMQLFFKTMCQGDATCLARSLSGTEWFLVFTCVAILIAQMPNLNSIAGTSLIGAITGVGFCTLIWVLSINKGRPSGVSYSPSDVVKSDMGKISRILNALGIIALVFRGHNVVLEIQGTLPSSSKHPSYKRMWKGVIVSYILIAMCQFPLAIAGFWAYGNQIPYNGGLLSTFSRVHGRSTSKVMMGLIYALVIVSCLCTFQVYAMPVFDNLEIRYTSKKQQPCPRWVRTCLRIFFGGLAFFIAVAFPFLGSLAPLVGGITLPLTLAYPCFMWISLKKPRPNGASWSLNLGLGCFGIVFSVLLVVAAAWTLADKGLNANFFKP
ncbi:lysine histidine transporter-like 8 isoform X2 [Alnus glutinosa]|uniref:lysine histidine transporter-like 8 isoform X2 n=1 Tax=Alnus glutinosa TaxID=3517 RepID=UPI002D79ECE0|nr:lysine histidine transporter-like 8 isoform X2 [Alnus glutinosa]